MARRAQTHLPPEPVLRAWIKIDNRVVTSESYDQFMEQEFIEKKIYKAILKQQKRWSTNL
jgi:hypothetical protein